MVFENKFLTSDKPGRGLVWDDSDGKLAKSFQESKEKEKGDEEKAHKERFAIPEEVKPGSAEMVWHTMKNTILVNEDVANKARQEGKPDERREALIEKQKMEQHMFNTVVDKSMPAIQAYDLMQKEIDGLERHKIPESTELDGYIEAAKSVQRRLLDESSRDNKK